MFIVLKHTGYRFLLYTYVYPITPYIQDCLTQPVCCPCCLRVFSARMNRGDVRHVREGMNEGGASGWGGHRVSRDQFQRYCEWQRKGLFNMLETSEHDPEWFEEEDVMYIIEHYEDLMKLNRTQERQSETDVLESVGRELQDEEVLQDGDHITLVVDTTKDRSGVVFDAMREDGNGMDVLTHMGVFPLCRLKKESILNQMGNTGMVGNYIQMVLTGAVGIPRTPYTTEVPYVGDVAEVKILDRAYVFEVGEDDVDEIQLHGLRKSDALSMETPMEISREDIYMVVGRVVCVGDRYRVKSDGVEGEVFGVFDDPHSVCMNGGGKTRVLSCDEVEYVLLS